LAELLLLAVRPAEHGSNVGVSSNVSK
jgi:hypothetical protein